MATDVELQFTSYDQHGGEKNLSLIAGLLEQTPIAASLRRVEITIWFTTRRPPRKSLESVYDDFNLRIAQLPKVKFHRKKATLSIDYASSLGPIEEVLPRQKTDYAFFAAALEEMQDVFSNLEPAQLAQWANAARLAAPASQDELESFAKSEEERKSHRHAAKSPWDLLGIDWEDFHPDARRILDDPFFWETANDFSPNGNDTGADLLHEARRDPRAHRDPIRFLAGLLRRWGVASMIAAALAKQQREWDDKDQTAITTHDEAAIALPFALIKHYGSAPRATIELAQKAIERQKSWPSAEKIVRKLRELPS